MSSSISAPSRANLRRRRSAILMLRVPSSTVSSRFLYSRLSQTLTARPCAVLVLADAHAFGIVAVGAERRGAGRADPLAAALVALLLLLETLLQRLHQLLPAAQRLDLRLLLVGQELLGELAQPLLRDLGRDALGGQRLEALEDVAEHPVELVEVPLVLHQDGARQIVEIVDAVVGDALLHRLHQRQVLLDGDRHLGRAQFEEEVDEHGAIAL